jgi:hypothetical protein
MTMAQEDRRKRPKYGITAEVEIHYDSKSISATGTELSNGSVEIGSSREILPGTTAGIGLGIPA